MESNYGEIHSAHVCTVTEATLFYSNYRCCQCWKMKMCFFLRTSTWEENFCFLCTPKSGFLENSLQHLQNS
jgi:hypothetical protein